MTICQVGCVVAPFDHAEKGRKGRNINYTSLKFGLSRVKNNELLCNIYITNNSFDGLQLLIGFTNN